MAKKSRKGRKGTQVERANAGNVSADEPALICKECKRDPEEVPAAKVVAHGLCAMDYNRARREALRRESGQEVIHSTRRLGVKARVTIWMTAGEQGEVVRTAREKRKSVSDFGSEAILAAVADHKKTAGANDASAA